MKKIVLFCFAVLALVGCRNSELIKSSEPSNIIALDEIEVIAPTIDAPKKASDQKVHDLLHTKLEVFPNWNDKTLTGTATLSFRPYFYPSNRLKLDAQSMIIESVNLISNDPALALDFEYDNFIIDISLDKTYQRWEEFEIEIKYIAQPEKVVDHKGKAITSNKGLFFINPDSLKTGVPTQLWTQGQAEASSCWFPTIDSPNERMTQEVYITVDKVFDTLCNGELVYSNYNDDDTRTDYWSQTLNHPPYLCMMAIGDFDISVDKWVNRKGQEVPLYYYLEPEYSPYAFEIFGRTPGMMSFFSELLDYDYPWSKYGQVVVREYVSGAMENTTATIHGDFVNQDGRSLLDYNNDDVIAHELVHHWFGNLVTCESWGHLALNESFATYGEFLWKEHDVSLEEGLVHLYDSRQSYFYDAGFKTHPIIRDYYNHPDDMFDSHSYDKGSQVLHMLRNTLGDSAFFRGLHHYLIDNAYNDVEIENLRINLEKTSGLNLEMFFDQWFHTPGHPITTIESSIMNSNASIEIIQTQLEKPDNFTFQFPVTVRGYFIDGTHEDQVVNVISAYEKFELNFEKSLAWVDVDPNRSLLLERTRIQDRIGWKKQFDLGNVIARKEALEYYYSSPDSIDLPLLISGLSDSSPSIRDEALYLMSNGDLFDDTHLDLVKDLASKDSSNMVRKTAFQVLAEHYQGHDLGAFLIPFTDEKSYYVASSSLAALAEFNVDEAVRKARLLESSNSFDLKKAVGKVYAKNSDFEHYNFFKEELMNGSDPSLKYFLAISLKEYLLLQSSQVKIDAVDIYATLIEKNDVWWVKTKGYEGIQQVIESLKLLTLTNNLQLNVKLEKAISNIEQRRDDMAAKEVDKNVINRLMKLNILSLE